MKLIIHDNIDDLIDIKNDFKKNNIKLFRYVPNTFSKNSYNFYIFTCDFNSENDLIEEYSTFNDIIAYDFQRKLLKNIEKWNVYLFLFVNNKISEEVKSLVEQNKYATRKLVFDNNEDDLSNEKKEKIIINKLFSLNITSKKSVIDDNEDLRNIIEKKDSILLETLESLKKIKTKKRNEKDKKSEIVKTYLELKKNE